MNKKVVLILADGMRPDSLDKCGNPYVNEFISRSKYTLEARTVMPSVTLPCHMSLFLSVTPDRHGITTNTYTPQVRPIEGLFEQVEKVGKKTAMFYDWEQLRDLVRPGVLAYSNYRSGGRAEGWYAETCKVLTREICEYLAKERPDFTFFYIGQPDEYGHKYGWMTDEYYASVSASFDSIKAVVDVLDDEYCVIVVADHGGHGRAHGTEMPEDMTIPVICYGTPFEAGTKFGEVSILDIAPTITELVGAEKNPEWEGSSIL